MTAILVQGGAYSAKNVIANLQRCVNWYPEKNPEPTKPPVPVTHYTRPGKVRFGQPVVPAAGRGLYTATNGKLYGVVNDTVYFINPAGQFFILGNIAAGANPISMADNGEHAGNDIVLVDGTTTGYTINMTTNAFAVIVDGTGLFQGADVVKFLQTYFLFNVPNTQNFIISLPDTVTFDPLDIAAKASHADNVMTIGLRQREVWLLGSTTTEPWSLTGAADFPFEEIPSAYVQYGSIAIYSTASADISLFWLSKNDQGQAMVMKSEGYDGKRISNHAIEVEFQKYATLSDAIGGTFQIGGHTFYALHFPTANKTWVYDLSIGNPELAWHEEAWTDADGGLNRDRTPFYAAAYGRNFGMDWETGEVYVLDPSVYNDFGGPITRIRGWPHVLDEMKRITHWNAIVDIACGTTTVQDYEPQVLLRYSDDRGKTWSDWLEAGMGQIGEYDTSPQFPQLGMARDRVYEILCTEDVDATLNGLYIDVEPSES